MRLRGFRTCAVIPALDEAPTVADVVLKTAKLVDEVIVIDDHSKDRTFEVAEKAGAHVYANGLGRGAQLATLFGVRRAAVTFPVVVTLDADGQHPPEAIPRILGPILAEEADFVLGRRHRIPGSERPSRLAVSAIVGVDHELDVATGFRAFSTRFLRQMRKRDVQYGGTGSFVLHANSHGARITEVKFNFLPRRTGVSKFANIDRLALHRAQASFLLQEYAGTMSPNELQVLHRRIGDVSRTPGRQHRD